MIDNLSKAKKADLEAEVQLYRDAGVEVAAPADLDTNAKLTEELEKLQAAHGFPVKFDEDFKKENPTLAKILAEAGAQDDEIVFAEQTDVDEAAKLDEEAAHRESVLAQLKDLGVEPVDPETKTTAELEEKLAEVQKEKAARNVQQSPAAAPSNGKKELVYTEKTGGVPVTVVSTNNVIFGGRQYIDVAIVSGQTLRLTPAEFEEKVTERA